MQRFFSCLWLHSAVLPHAPSVHHIFSEYQLASFLDCPDLNFPLYSTKLFKRRAIYVQFYEEKWRLSPNVCWTSMDPKESRRLNRVKLWCSSTAVVPVAIYIYLNSTLFLFPGKYAVVATAAISTRPIRPWCFCSPSKK